MRSSRLAAAAVALATLAAPSAYGQPLVPSILVDLHPEAAPAWFGAPTVRPLGDLTRTHHPRVHEGVRVLGQDLLVFSRDGAFVHAVGTAAPLDEVPAATVAPGVAEIAAQALHPGSTVLRSTPLILPDGPRWQPIHAVDLLLRTGLPRRLHVSATEPVRVLHDLDPVRQDNHFEGTVQVYDGSELLGPLVVRPVVELEYETWLVSEDRRVIDQAHTEPQELQYSGDGTWHFEPDDWRFSIAMGFYHLQTHELFQAEVAGGDPWFDQLVHPEVGWVNIGTDSFDDPSYALRAGHAYYESAGGWLHVYLFGDGDYPGYTAGNFAHDAEVWAHEQGHGITSEATPFVDTDVRPLQEEFDALHEGLADYGAVAYTGDTNILEWVFDDVPDVHRPVDEVREYPDDWESGGDPHENGRIISSMAWTLRQRIGEPADRIVLASRWYLTSGDAGFAALADGMLLVDEEAFERRYAVPLLESLERHGIEPDAVSQPPTAVATVQGPVRLDAEVTLVADADGTSLGGVSWTLASAPDDSAFTEVVGEARWDRELTFTPDVCGEWLFDLRVSSRGWRLSDRESVEVITCGAGCACSSSSSDAPAWLALLALLLVVRRVRAA